MKDEWRIGDIIFHKSKDGNNLKRLLDTYDYIEDCEKYHCVNLSLRGRRAAASTAKKVRRGLHGRFEPKYPIWEYKKSIEPTELRVKLALYIVDFFVTSTAEDFDSFKEADKILDIIKGNI